MWLLTRGRFRRSLWLIVVAILSAVTVARGEWSLPRDVHVADLPREARSPLELIKRGGPYPYDRDGVTFGNYEQRLPPQPRGYYREYTVPTPGLSHRGARRLVVGCDRRLPSRGTCGAGGEFYYTDDHYRSFRHIIE